MDLAVTNGTSEMPFIITRVALVVVQQLLAINSPVVITLTAPAHQRDLLLIAELAMRLKLDNSVTILFFVTHHLERLKSIHDIILPIPQWSLL
jgi:hypothetical protein